MPSEFIFIGSFYNLIYYNNRLFNHLELASTSNPIIIRDGQEISFQYLWVRMPGVKIIQILS